jgi:hypothetical protein
MTLPFKYIAVAAAALSAAGDLQAQHLAQSRAGMVTRSASIRASLGALRLPVFAPDNSPNVGLMLLSGIGLGAVGVLVGGLAGEQIDENSCAPGDDFCGLGGLIVGAFIGETLALPLGVHIAGKKGSYGLELVTSLGITALGVAAANATDGISLVFIPPLQLWACIAQELRAAKRRQ